MVNFKTNPPFFVRFFSSLAVFIFSLGFVYTVDPPDPAEAQEGHRICRGIENNFLYIKVNKDTICENIWTDVQSLIDMAGDEIDIEYDTIKDWDGKTRKVNWFQYPPNYHTCELFTEKVFPEYGENVCYQLDSVTVDRESAYDDSKLGPEWVKFYSQYYKVGVEIDNVIMPGPLVITQKENLGVCKVDTCTISYSYQHIDQLGAAITVGASAGWTATVTATVMSGAIEGVSQSYTASLGDSMTATLPGGFKRFSFVTEDSFEFNPEFDLSTESNCDEKFTSNLDKIASAGESLDGVFTGFKTVYFGVSGCLKQMSDATSAIDCSVKYFGDPVPGKAKSCYYYDGPGS